MFELCGLVLGFPKLIKLFQLVIIIGFVIIIMCTKRDISIGLNGNYNYVHLERY